MNHVLHGVQNANMGRNNFEGETGKPYRVTLRSSVQNTAEPIEVPFRLWGRMGQSIMCYMGGQIPRGKGHFW